MNGKEVQNLSVKERKAMGLGYIPSDRHKDAMVPDFSITENFLLGYQEDPKYCKKGFIDYKALEEDAKVQVEQFEIKIAGVSQHIGQLSGGNQQKVIIGRWLLTNPDFLILDEPTRGIDVGAKYEIYQIMIDLVKQGKSIIMISSEMPELIGMSNRIIVMCNGHITGEVEGEEATQERIMSFATQFDLQGKSTTESK